MPLIMKVHLRNAHPSNKARCWFHNWRTGHVREPISLGMKQTAKMLDDAKHGLFSYYLMKGMEGDADANKDKKITSGELHKYVLANVSRMQRNQTPELQGDQSRVLVQW